MKIDIEDVDSCNKKIKFEIPHQEYDKKVKAYYQKLGREVKVPGFRKGKVPIALLEKQFGPDVKKEVLSNLISEELNNAIVEKDLRAVGQPHLLEVNAEEGTDISVSASVEVLPTVELQDYSGIELKITTPRVTDEEVDQTIEALRQRKAENVQVTGRPSQDKDLLKIDFTSKLGDQPFEGGSAQDQIIQAGGGQLIEGLDKGMIGMEIGETRDIQVQVPEDYHNKEIAGKDVDFQIVLKGIQEQKLPELDDEFARNVEDKDYASLDDMKQRVRSELEDFEHKEAKKAVKKELAEKITEQNQLDIPEGLLKDQVKFMAEQARKKEAKEDHQHQGHDHDHDHDHGVEVTPELLTQYREPAMKALQEELVLDQLARDLKAEVTEEELEQEVKNMSQLLGGGNLQQIKREWEKNGILARLHNRMKRDKTLDAALEKVTIKEEKVDRKDLIADN
ncbi:MAG: trigger factor [Nitrospina sp.]|jgi:trigger factor|nr:trigger factor [Nitrospina sp.]MBT3858031.1 trigger factor [Nitrospina sp.]MBT4105475.1 trigger factor [Nitrospina sp.]MBT4390030.1 trigger factor [Nitrospina sp.]MBT4621177.1 trigger factor [Nitrospina sp.]